MRTRIAILVSHPVQYFVGLYAKLAERFDVTALYACREGLTERYSSEFGTTYSWDIPLLEGYRSEFLRSLRPYPSVERFWGLINPGAFTAIRRDRFDLVLVHGWASATMCLGISGALAHRVPFLLTGDGDLHPTTPVRRAVKRAVLPVLLRLAGGALYSGMGSRELYLAYGMRPDRLFFGPWCVDNERFALTLGADERATLRDQYGVDPMAIVILFAGKLVARKRPADLVHAIARVRARTSRDVQAMFVGDGALADEVNRLAEMLRVPVHLAGFRNQMEMPLLYQLADVFCLPSQRDTRGAVVNEAMAAGLPVVISEGVNIWKPGDLLQDGVNGFVVGVGDVAALADRIARLVLDPSLRARMGAASKATVAGWSYDAFADGVAAAARAILGHE